LRAQWAVLGKSAGWVGLKLGRRREAKSCKNRNDHPVIQCFRKVKGRRCR